MRKIRTAEFNMTPQEVINAARENGNEVDRLQERNIMRCKRPIFRKKLMKYAEEVGAVKFKLTELEKEICLERWHISTRSTLEAELKDLVQLTEGSGDLMADFAEGLNRNESESFLKIKNKEHLIRQMLETGDYSEWEKNHPVDYSVGMLYIGA